MIKIWTIEEAAEDAFAKAEYVLNLQMMNTPTDYEERKKAFVELARARAAAAEAEHRLLEMSKPKPDPMKYRMDGTQYWQQ
jgi:hypothetical protein